MDDGNNKQLFAAAGRFRVSAFVILLVFAAATPFTFPQATDQRAGLIAAGDKEAAAAHEFFDKGTLDGYRAAVPKFKAAADLFERAGDTAKHAEALLFAGRSLDDSGEAEQALAVYEKCLPLFRSISGYEGEAVTYNNIGRIFFQRSEIDAARTNFEKALEIVDRNKVESVEALVTSNLGNVYDSQGEKRKAVQFYKRSIDAARKAGDVPAEAYGLNNLGKVQSELGDRKTALQIYESVLKTSSENHITDLEIVSLNNIGTLYFFLGDNERAVTWYRRALEKIAATGIASQKALVINNLGQSYHAAADEQKAVEYYEQAYQLAKAAGDQSLQSVTLNNQGLTYMALNDLSRASGYFERAIEIARRTGDRPKESAVLLNIANVQHMKGEFQPAIENLLKVIKITETTLDVRLAVTALNNVGTIYLASGDAASAMIAFDRALPAARRHGDRSIEAKILNNIGRSQARLGEKSRAVAYFNEALSLARSLGERSMEAGILTNLMFGWDDLGLPKIAAFFGKQSVNGYQALRSNLTSFDNDIQRSYLSSVEGTYRKLVSILIAQGRIAEAEQILVLLKQEEVLDYVRRDDKVARGLLENVALAEDERAAIERYAALAEKVTAIGKEFGELDAERKASPTAEFPRQARYDQLKIQLADASTAFEKFLEELKVIFGKDVRVAQIDSGVQKILARAKAKKTVAVSTIVGTDKLSLIVTTANTQRAHTVKIGETEINKLVADFRQVLVSPQYDPRPAAQAIYDILVKPIEGDLAGADADMILWSLDGSLRYIPPAAIWDKNKGYLAERFANGSISLASRDTLALPAASSNNRGVLGVGVSQASEGFAPLTAVPDELNCIVNDASARPARGALQCASGVLEGRKLLDDAFTLASFENEIGRYPIIHIASHFELTPGDDKRSFLLLGGGSNRRFTVEQLRNQSLIDVELIVLSACNTATPGGAKTNGVEIEGFGSIAQEAGAKAVMATLWSVADTSTKDLMVEFYKLYGKSSVNKADALRRAQLILMKGKYESPSSTSKRAEVYTAGEEKKNYPSFERDPRAPFAHPYYWAPFVLIGNWK